METETKTENVTENLRPGKKSIIPGRPFYKGSIITRLYCTTNQLAIQGRTARTAVLLRAPSYYNHHIRDRRF